MPTTETTPTTEVNQDLKTEEVQISQNTTTSASPSEEVTPPVEEVKPEEVPGLAEAVEEVEEYELSRSENTTLSDEDFEAFIAEAQEKGYSKETAELILKAKEEAADKYSDKFKNKGLEDLKAETHKQLLADEMFNTPEKYAAAIEDAKLVFSHFGDKELAEALKNPIIGSNPAIFKFVQRIAKVMKSEGAEELNKGESKGMTTGNGKSFLDSFYPDM